MCKLVSSGQGGFCVTKDAALANRLRELRTHGLSSTFSAAKWSQLGFNFRYNDILASVALSQLSYLDDYISAHRHIDKSYRNLISNLILFQLILLIPPRISLFIMNLLLTIDPRGLNT